MMAFGLRMNENRLSDMVWALCQVDRRFLQDFFDFSFEKTSNEIKVYFALRECYLTGGRNDFAFFTSRGLYILESKLHDTSINTGSYLDSVKRDQERIRYILTFDDPGRYNGWKIDGNKLKSEVGRVSIEYNYVLWGEYAKHLLEKENEADWRLLGAFIFQVLYQQNCGFIDYFEKFNFSDTLLSINQEAKNEINDSETWRTGAFHELSKTDDDRIWNGFVYSPTQKDGTIHVLGVPETVFVRIFIDNPFHNFVFEKVEPLGLLNRGEGWFYFKINNDDDTNKAIEELKEFLSKG